MLRDRDSYPPCIRNRSHQYITTQSVLHMPFGPPEPLPWWFIHVILIGLTSPSNGVVALPIALLTSPAKKLILFCPWCFSWPSAVLPVGSTYEVTYTRGRAWCLQEVRCLHFHCHFQLCLLLRPESRIFSETKIQPEAHEAIHQHQEARSCIEEHMSPKHTAPHWPLVPGVDTMCTWADALFLSFAFIAFSFLGISLQLYSFLNACLCLLITWGIALKLSFSLCTLSLSYRTPKPLHAICAEEGD